MHRKKISIHFQTENLLAMKYKIVLVPFPFDNFSDLKVRPAICLTDKIDKYNHVVIAFITSQISKTTGKTDIRITNIKNTGLKTNSTIKIHRIVTIPTNLIKRELGKLPDSYHKIMTDKLKILFEID